MTHRLLKGLLGATLGLTCFGVCLLAAGKPQQPEEQAGPDAPQLVGLVSPATVAESITVWVDHAPPGATLTLLLDDHPWQPLAPEAVAAEGAQRVPLQGVFWGRHSLAVEASLPDGSRQRSAPVELHVLRSLNDHFSPTLQPYGGASAPAPRPLGQVLETLATPAVSLSAADEGKRAEIAAMYLNWGVDPAYDNEHDQSELLPNLSPTGWAAPAALPFAPLSLRFSPDAPFYQRIPRFWPRVALPAGYFHSVQLNSTEGGDGIGFGISVAHAPDPELPVRSQWHENASTLRSFRFQIDPDWAHRIPWQQSGDQHVIFVDGANASFFSAYKTSVDSETGGPQALYASDPTPLNSMGDRGGSNAAGFADLPVMLQPGEATDLLQPIRHALGGAVSRPWAARVYPAISRDADVLTSQNSCTGEGYTNTGLLPYGSVLQLDPALDLNTLHLSLPARRILEALQTYGYYVMDFGCADFDIYTAVPEAEFAPFGGLWGDDGQTGGVQNEIRDVITRNTWYVVAPLVKKR